MENLNLRSSNPFLSWAYLCQEKTVEELRHSLLYTSLELEQTKMAVLEETRKRDDQCSQLKDLLSKTMKERDEAREKCQRLLLENLMLQQNHQQSHHRRHHRRHHHQQQPQIVPNLSAISSVEDEPRRGIDSGNGFSSSDCDESIVSSPIMELAPPAQVLEQSAAVDLVPEKALPEKGKLLQAVIKAGPLLQTLLLAGPLPQWRHPPPPLESFEIPPVTIPSPPRGPPQFPPRDSSVSINAFNCGRVNDKRILFDGSDSPTQTKHPRLVLH